MANVVDTANAPGTAGYIVIPAMRRNRRKQVDIQVENHGSIFLMRPLSNAGVKFLDHVYQNAEDAQYFGNALVVEHGYIVGMVDAAREFGLEVR